MLIDPSTCQKLLVETVTRHPAGRVTKECQNLSISTEGIEDQAEKYSCSVVFVLLEPDRDHVMFIRSFLPSFANSSLFSSSNRID